MASPELNSKIAEWRQKALDGTLTQEELREAVQALSQDRRGAAVASETSRKSKAIREIPSADDLLAELGEL